MIRTTKGKEMISMMQTMTFLDAQLLLWIQQNLRSDAATVFWEFMTDLGNMGFLWILITVGLLIRSKTRSIGLTAALAIVLNTVISNGILKLWVARPWPFSTFTEIIPLITPPVDFSFPSGHTSSSFAVAFVLFALLPRRWGVGALVTAALISLSRLYLGVHYPTDVLTGVLIGYGVAKMAVWAVKKWEARRISASQWHSAKLY